MSLFTVITADVIASRQQPVALADKEVALAGINHPDLLTAFTVSRGDEVQAVVSRPVLPLDLVRRLRFYCRPLSLRVGLGIGRITNGLEKKNSWDMNGPAFFRSRRALETLKNERRVFTRVYTGDDDFDRLANALLVLMDAVQSGWTDAQWEAVTVYEEKGTYQEAAKILGIAYQNVEKRCRAARWWAVHQAENALALAAQELARHHLIMGEK